MLEDASAEMSGAGLGQHYRKYRRFNLADARFHQTIIASAGNPVFVQVYKDLQPHVHYARLYLSRSAESEVQVNEEHQAILAAYRAGDAEAAQAKTVAHISAAGHRLLADAAQLRTLVGEISRPRKR
jgi:DNA-binding GntR family transcriptional regulator